jgi:hypothetical protein
MSVDPDKDFPNLVFAPLNIPTKVPGQSPAYERQLQEG